MIYVGSSFVSSNWTDNVNNQKFIVDFIIIFTKVKLVSKFSTTAKYVVLTYAVTEISYNNFTNKWF